MINPFIVLSDLKEKTCLGFGGLTGSRNYASQCIKNLHYEEGVTK